MTISEDHLSDLVGVSYAVRELKKLIQRAALVKLPVLLTGESGTGKTLIARTIHELSGRKGAFVSANLATLTPGLAAAELSGFSRGSFTGAVSDRVGLIEAANRGTLYLDELETAGLETQALLVRFLSTETVHRVGDSRERSVDVRVISSMTKISRPSSALRRDLIDRLAGIVIDIPPLRKRKEDIPELAAHFLAAYPGRKLSKAAANKLKSHDFLGNVRELYSVLARAVSMTDEAEIKPEHLEFVRYDDDTNLGDSSALPREVAGLRAQLDGLQRSTIQANPIWEGRRFIAETDYCFVLMPFREARDLQRVFTDHVKPVVEKRCNLRCERADDIYDINGVMQSVWEGINRARVIIADMTERNPNVFYELGIAHTLGKPVIMITQSMDYVPSDLKHLRCIVYEYKPGLIEKFEQSLEKTIQRVLSSTLPAAAELRQE